MLNSVSARVACSHCDRTFVADKGEDGCPELDLVPCQGSDSCFEKLCVDCRQMCDFCGLWGCEEHIREGPAGLRICDICFADEEPEIEECQCQNSTGRWDLQETWDASGCPVHSRGGRNAA